MSGVTVVQDDDPGAARGCPVMLVFVDQLHPAVNCEAIAVFADLQNMYLLPRTSDGFC